MFLKKNKGDMVVQFVVLLVAAIIMIFFITGYAAKIWGAFFPSDDKSTTRSIDTFYSLISTKSVSPLDYEMTPYTLYLKKGFCMIFFTGPTATYTVSSTSTVSIPSGIGGTQTSTNTLSDTRMYYAPKSCEDKQCICLYDGMPNNKESKKEKNLLNCVKLLTPININQSLFDISGRVCPADDQKEYRPYMVIRRTVDGKPYIYIINDNVDNRKLDESWAVPMCTDDPNTLVGSFCFGKSDGSTVTFNDDAGLKKIYEYCAAVGGKNYTSTSVTCEYVVDKKSWQLNCTGGDISAECGKTGGKYETCNNINQLNGIKPYVSMNNDYVYYRMCVDDTEYCNLGCKINEWDIYISTDTNSPDGTVLYSVIDANANLQDCSIKYLDGFPGKYGKFLASYDTTKSSCVDEINKYFYPDRSTMLACNSSRIDCQNLINEKKRDCAIKYLDNGNTFWITYYDTTNSACDTDIKKMFGTAYFCSSK